MKIPTPPINRYQGEIYKFLGLDLRVITHDQSKISDSRIKSLDDPTSTYKNALISTNKNAPRKDL